MAWLKDIVESCRICSKRASVELLNRYNSSMGKFCKRCGKLELKRIQKTEDAQ